MELYINSEWTSYCGGAFRAEAIAFSSDGNNLTIHATGKTASEADDRLRAGLCELKLLPETLTH